MKKQLKASHEKIARLRVKKPGASMEEIGRAAGRRSPRQAASYALKRPDVQARVKELLDGRPKLRLPALFKKLEEGLDAKETKFFAHEGKVKDQRDCVDFPTRKSYLDLALELHQAKTKKVDLTSNGNTIKNLLLDDDKEK